MADASERRKPLRGVAVADFQWIVKPLGDPSAIQVFIDEADAQAYADSKGVAVEALLGAGGGPGAAEGRG